MSKSRINDLKRYLKIQEITQKTINEKKYDVKYSAIWRNIIYPVYYISYATYIKIINLSGLKRQIEELESKESEKTKKGKRIDPPKWEYYF